MIPDSQAPAPTEPVAILLAAGRGRRFDASGQRDKLLQPLANGVAVAIAAANNLQAVFSKVIAVVRADNAVLMDALRNAGCDVVVCANADDGMAASLVQGLKHAATAGGWLIALADMPFVKPATIAALRNALIAGAGIVAPLHDGRRGNPVGFNRRYLYELSQLKGDTGARQLLERFAVTTVAVDDGGVLRDVDTVEDL